METAPLNTAASLDFSLLDIFSPSVLLIVFLLVLGIFSILSAILLYHWREYALNVAVAKKAMRVYFAVSGFFILILSVSLLALTF